MVMVATLFCAVGPNCWGIGKTQGDAIKQAKKNWPSYIGGKNNPKNYSVYGTDAPEFYVGDLGEVGINSPKGTQYTMAQVQKSLLAA